MTSVRLAAVRRLTELLTIEVDAHVNNAERVQVISYDPGNDLRREAIFVVDVSGEVDEPYLAGSADQPTEDDFEVVLLCRCAWPGSTGEAVQDRVDELYEAVRRTVLGEEYGSTLEEMLGDDGTSVIAGTSLGTIDGPLVGPTDEGFLGLYRVSVRMLTEEVSP